MVDLRAVDVTPSLAADAAAEATASAARALAVVRALARLEGAPRLWLVTRGAQPVGERGCEVVPAQAPVWGLGRVVALEHPERWGGLIDLDPAEGPDAAAAQSWPSSSRATTRTRSRFATVRRHVPRLVRAPGVAEGSITVRADGAYLVTGGLGGLGLHVARWLVERGRAIWCCWAAAGCPPARRGRPRGRARSWPARWRCSPRSRRLGPVSTW